MTAPGQTTGVSVFIDPLIADLGISRTQVSTAYLTGTLVGACAMHLVGRMIYLPHSRLRSSGGIPIGPRQVITVMAAVFGAILITLSFVTGLPVATTTVAYWFDRRRGLALGITGAVGISLVPLMIERLVAAYGWRQAWATVAPCSMLTTGLNFHPPRRPAR